MKKHQQMKKHTGKDILRVIILGTIIFISLILILNNITSNDSKIHPIVEKQSPQFSKLHGIADAQLRSDKGIDAEASMPAAISMTAYLKDVIMWYDIILLLIVWGGGVFFNRSLHRLAH